jgi:hypothetical protein
MLGRPDPVGPDCPPASGFLRKRQFAGLAFFAPCGTAAAMLARPEKYKCIECGLPFGADGFALYYGRLENGPAYWSDRGVLCSPKCSLKHHRKRAAEGMLPDEPAGSPFGN